MLAEGTAVTGGAVGGTFDVDGDVGTVMLDDGMLGTTEPDGIDASITSEPPPSSPQPLSIEPNRGRPNRARERLRPK